MSLNRQVALAGSQCLSMNDFEEFLAGFLELLRRLVVTDLESDSIEYFKGHPWFQIGRAQIPSATFLRDNVAWEKSTYS